MDEEGGVDESVELCVDRGRIMVMDGWLYIYVCFLFFCNDTATTEIYTSLVVGSVRCV